jgi:alkylation response protein AidB-like acyl-CoA dehydrogenase
MSTIAEFLSYFSYPIRWSNQRIAFGRPLHAQAVVRAKLAGMISRVESSQNWIESITYQMNHVNP